MNAFTLTFLTLSVVACSATRDVAHAAECSGETYNRRLAETIAYAHAAGKSCEGALLDVAALERTCNVTPEKPLHCPDSGREAGAE